MIKFEEHRRTDIQDAGRASAIERKRRECV